MESTRDSRRPCEWKSRTFVGIIRPLHTKYEVVMTLLLTNAKTSK